MASLWDFLNPSRSVGRGLLDFNPQVNSNMLGAPAPAQVSVDPLPQQDGAQQKIARNPALSAALLKMGAALAESGARGDSTLSGIGLGASAFAQGYAGFPQEQAELEIRKAQADAYRARAEQEKKDAQYGIKSGGFEGDIARARVIMADPNSTESEKRIAQGVIDTASRLQGSYDPVTGEYRYNPRAQFGNQPYQSSMGVSAASSAPMPAPATAPVSGMTLAGPDGEPPMPITNTEMVPPPSGTSVPSGAGLFTPTGNRKTDAELQKKAAEIAIEEEAKRRSLIAAAQGEAGASYESQLSKLPQLEETVAKLDELADKANYTIASQARDFIKRQTGQEVSDGAVARRQYMALVDNQILPLLRDTFGAQFTVKEGESLRATLGDVDASPAEKKAVLRAFIDQKKANLEASARQSGMAVPDEAAPKKRLRFNPQTGELEE